MLFLSLYRPSHQEQKRCINKAGDFNYNNKLIGATAKSAFTLKQDKEISDGSFLVNHARVLVGSGLETFEKGKNALQSWRHFSLNWAFVDPKTPIQSGVKFCVCSKAIFPWLLLPLKVVYVDDSRNQKNAVASYSFGSGTLQGHLLLLAYTWCLLMKPTPSEKQKDNKIKLSVVAELLSRISRLISHFTLNIFTSPAGEECFSITMDEQNDVWYEILSFSKPASLLSFIGYPYVLLKQKHFARESTLAMQKHLSVKLDNVSKFP